ncbi:MAG: hypothetical protein U0U25_11040 [Flavobacteriales bacterium]
MTMETHPFAPATTPTPEQWQRYLRGELSATERHAVERAIEQDPLLRDALEGAAVPGGMAGMEQLRAHRPPVTNGVRWPWLLGGALLVAGAAWLLWPASQADPVAKAPDPEVPVTVEERVAFAQEVEEATPLPPAEQVGPAAMERFIERDAARIEREPPPARMDPKGTAVERGTPVAAPGGLRMHREGRRLMFLHDLKAVDPVELYPPDRLLQVRVGAVEAPYADAPSQSQARATAPVMAYRDFLDEALGRFAAGDRRGCLEDLFFLLDQYPEDVNALFYAGLCAYELGLSERALLYLQRARDHRVDSFREEAAWYHALALFRSQGVEVARTELQAVADAGGFYAARAKAVLEGGK